MFKSHRAGAGFPLKGLKPKRLEIIAALLRTLAEQTGGYCAARDATDNRFISGNMVFSFTSKEQRAKFRQRVERYLSESARGCFVLTDL
ncbi:MAG TPA: hypothetical protein VFA81_08320 [Burkholderiales bacterium]|nr:hypothetical protein [Burkholderiales bacterium]